MDHDPKFNEKVIATVRFTLEQLMSDRNSFGKAVLTPQNTGEGSLSVNQIYWACCKLHEAHWLGRPLFETDGVRVSWDPGRHIWYD